MMMFVYVLLNLLQKITANMKQSSAFYAFKVEMALTPCIAALKLIAGSHALLNVIFSQKALVGKLLHITVYGSAAHLVTLALEMFSDFIDCHMPILALLKVIQYDFSLLCAVYAFLIIFHFVSPEQYIFPL